MANSRISHLAGLCAICSLLWLSYRLERHALTRLSASLILLVSGLIAFATSVLSKRLPGANGRFDRDKPSRSLVGSSRSALPFRPRRYFLHGLIAAIVVRLELSYRVDAELQCAAPGVECFLPAVLLLYELINGRKATLEAEEDIDFPTLYEEIRDALRATFGSKPILILIVLAIAIGASWTSTLKIKSTFFCSINDGALLVVASQWLSLSLDAIIIIMLWRVLAWTSSLKQQLNALGTILLASSAASSFLLVALGLLSGSTEHASTVRLLNSPSAFDIIADGLVVTIFLISFILVIPYSTPSTLACTNVFLSGFLTAGGLLYRTGSWMNVNTTESYLAFAILGAGFSMFVYTGMFWPVSQIKRTILVLNLAVLLIAATIFTISRNNVLNRHPVQRLIYDKRVEADRWLVHAAVSKSLKVAVEEYRERNYGRNPPPNFDKWFNFARERKSPIIDHFAQISSDILPFWKLTPESIRKGLDWVVSQPDIALVTVHDGSVSHDLEVEHPQFKLLQDLVAVIRNFSQDLPGMKIAVNVNESPRVLAKLLKRSDGVDVTALAVEPLAPAHDIWQKTALTCPHGFSGMSDTQRNIRDACMTCVEKQSDGQFLGNWDLSQDLCHQRDMSRLHGFHIVEHDLNPFQQLLPVFSRSKTSSYSDVLIPLGRTTSLQEKDPGSEFVMRADKLFWRGQVDARKLNYELLHGGHEARLVHLLNNASTSAKLVALLPTLRSRERFRYESVSVTEMNQALQLDIGFIEPDHCENAQEACGQFEREFGSAAPGQLFQNRYILVMDGNDGPPIDLLPALESSSLPFVASIFREWYTERLLPWVHFVPIDLRFHAFHSTLAYFTGLKGKIVINGRDPEMSSNINDAEWIAEQGQRWARKAIREEDMQVYLFRLLLEWARVTNDKRDEIGFHL